MKCANCGKEIADDSQFCEFCGAQINPIKEEQKARWVVMTIVFVFFVLGLGALAYYESDSKIYAAEQAKREAEERATNAEQAKIEAEEKLMVWTNYTSQIPFVITDIQIANEDGNRNILTNFGSTIYSSNTMYLAPKIKYYGMSAGTKIIKVKLYKPDGTLSTGKTSPADCTYKKEKYFYTGHNEITFMGWGGTDKGHWKAGTYRFEFWYNNTCLGQKSFSVY